MSRLGWRYRCSICDALLEPDDVRAHVEAHRAEPGWAGRMNLTRVDDEPESEDDPGT